MKFFTRAYRQFTYTGIFVKSFNFSIQTIHTQPNSQAGVKSIFISNPHIASHCRTCCIIILQLRYCSLTSIINISNTSTHIHNPIQKSSLPFNKRNLRSYIIERFFSLIPDDSTPSCFFVPLL